MWADAAQFLVLRPKEEFIPGGLLSPSLLVQRLLGFEEEELNFSHWLTSGHY